jgi:hypothetical protein
MPNGSPVPTAIHLSLNAQIAGDWLHLNYEIENASDSTWLSYDAGATLAEDGPRELSAIAPVSFAPPASLRVMQVRQQPPEGRDMFVVRHPFVRRIEPGAKLAGRLRVSCPVTERNQYRPDYSGATYDTLTAEQVELWIGGFVPTEHTVLVPSDDLPGVYSVQRGHGEQKIVTATAAATVPVRVRTDAKFERFGVP